MRVKIFKKVCLIVGSMTMHQFYFTVQRLLPKCRYKFENFLSLFPYVRVAVFELTLFVVNAHHDVKEQFFFFNEWITHVSWHHVWEFLGMIIIFPLLLQLFLLNNFLDKWTLNCESFSHLRYYSIFFLWLCSDFMIWLNTHCKFSLLGALFGTNDFFQLTCFVVWSFS